VSDAKITPPEVTEFRVTFGEKYAREPHPKAADLPFTVHPDGWASIYVTARRGAQTPAWWLARKFATEQFGPYWSDLYMCEPEVSAGNKREWTDMWPLGQLYAWRLELAIDA
jgi:hypothetical protein